MRFDLRLPIGFLFSILWTSFLIYSLFTPPEAYARSLGINVNLYWGVGTR